VWPAGATSKKSRCADLQQYNGTTAVLKFAGFSAFGGP
jgi:hypothetical protein